MNRQSEIIKVLSGRLAVQMSCPPRAKCRGNVNNTCAKCYVRWAAKRVDCESGTRSEDAPKNITSDNPPYKLVLYKKDTGNEVTNGT